MRTVSVPAMANAHSHAFQIDLRGVGERVAPGDDFWSWRSGMYALAGALTPASMGDVGARAYSAMARAGYGSVGEFHYVVHRADGTPYEDPNAMAVALASAAVAAGLEIVLLPAAYGRAGFRTDVEPGQVRFADRTLDAFLARLDALRSWASGRPGVSVGVAAHSVRAVPSVWLTEIARYAENFGLVRHVHASEQRRELEECSAEHGCSPIELLERCGFLGPTASVVHGIHVSDRDIALLAASGTTVVSCPTTEGNLGDGWLPALRYRDAGVPLAIGTDQQIRIDPFEECRELETLARREGQTRDALLAACGGDLWGELARNGRRSLGLAAPGPPIEVDLDHPDLAGVPAGHVAAALSTCASAGVVRRGVGPGSA